MIDFAHNIFLIYGDAGVEWLKNLPKQRDDLTVQFGLRDLSTCENLSYNYVAAGFKAHEPVILKIGIDLPAIKQEYEAICAFNGHGLIKLIDADLDKGAILITRAIPGNTLTTLFPEQDDAALGIACDLVEQLHKATIPISIKFPHLSEWLSIVDKDWGVPHQQLLKARSLKKDLLNKSPDVLLHGDVHYANILENGTDWVVIDPKGVIGPAMYDITGALLREPFKEMMVQPDIGAVLRRRMNFVAQYTNCDFQEVLAWTYVQTVMSMCWSLEDGQDITEKSKFLDVLEGL